MTNPSLSWIDRERFGRLVEGATLAPRAPVARQRRVLTGTSSVPAASVTVSSIPPVTAILPFVSPANGLEANLHALVEWIEEELGSRAAFIADDNGLAVVESARAQQGHMAATSSILLLLGSIRSLMGDMGQWISLRTASGVLHFVEVETSWGRFGVGLLTDGALSAEAQTALERAVPSAFVE